MKKMLVVMIALAIGASVACANSLGVPWFMDTAPAFQGVPHLGGKGVTALVTLKSNETTPLTCYIAYYNADGVMVGPFAPDNSFVIQPLSSMAFRPVAIDPDATVGTATYINNYGESVEVSGANGGQEGGQGVLVPNRPMSPDSTTTIPGVGIVDMKNNGSCVISWFGASKGDKAIQGQYASFQTSDRLGASQMVTMSYAHLLPPGV